MRIADLKEADLLIVNEISIEIDDTQLLSDVVGVETYTGDDGWTDVIADSDLLSEIISSEDIGSGWDDGEMDSANW